ncbi:unnamed protein product [Didymodactylos carnosus]|uniref:Methylcrotonoyl-CoA carboxylase subunit alpha, mitochondrial n=3 Tax=Didymodactylos carnosus TaxID=1234261 RepID=A0A814GC47_9BILA|nr:unnamed protein product [Didymodactylos carnosus]CAF3766424.1 unnamed protein product [Didymodactylos carnosus]
MTFSKILIANRGEIACRVIRTARRLGLKSVAVYSDADKNSLHVRMADEAVRIGPAQALQSYLKKENVIEAALKTNSQAIHPGYGFLSENYEFCNMCNENNLVFIGPPPNAIRDMGIKNLSKNIMTSANVPVIYGYHGEDQNNEKLQQEAKKIGYPVMIKAVRGGGGKGMRIAFKEEEFLDQLNAARSEAMKSFNDDSVLIEKFIQRPRHVEVQVFGDMHKNYVYLFERDCSVQRRHQKIIEEAPAPGINWSTRKKLGEAACKAARAVNYVGAGTVEFIMDENHEFYFMEMNTRLQVEHPITEMITGTDLVEWQIKIAQGEPIPLKQDEIKLNGHSFEARIYAEEPNNEFMPGAGLLTYLRTPPITDGKIRVETGVLEGDEVSVHYDPMIAKLVVWSTTRLNALQKLRAALQQYYIGGLKTNIPFLISLCDSKKFQLGNVHTDFIKENKQELFHVNELSSVTAVAAAYSYFDYQTKSSASQFVSDPFSPFALKSSFRPNFLQKHNITLLYDNKDHNFQIESLDATKSIVYYQGKRYNIEIRPGTADADEITMLINDHQFHCRLLVDGDQLTFYSNFNRTSFDFKHRSPSFVAALEKSGGTEGGTTVDPVAPMPGIIDKVYVKEGTHVNIGQPLLVMTAMKMEHIIKATKTGVVDKILFHPGQVVKKGEKLLIFKQDDTLKQDDTVKQ